MIVSNEFLAKLIAIRKRLHQYPELSGKEFRTAKEIKDLLISNRPDTPLRWSEDFGHFTSNYPGAIFGIGAGNNHPNLHSTNYDFPDAILECGINMFWGIINGIQSFD